MPTVKLPLERYTSEYYSNSKSPYIESKTNSSTCLTSCKNHKDSRSLMFVERKANNHSLSARFVKPMPKSMIDSFLSNHEENHISKIETVYQKKCKRINECKENKSIKKKPKNYRVVINL